MLVDLQNQIQQCRFNPAKFCCVLSFPASSYILCNAAGFDRRTHFSASRIKELIREYFETNIADRSEEHTSELQSLMRISYAVFCLKKQHPSNHTNTHNE